MVNEIWTCWNCAERNAQSFNREDISERKRRKIGISRGRRSLHKDKAGQEWNSGETHQSEEVSKPGCLRPTIMDHKESEGKLRLVFYFSPTYMPLHFAERREAGWKIRRFMARGVMLHQAGVGARKQRLANRVS